MLMTSKVANRRTALRLFAVIGVVAALPASRAVAATFPEVKAYRNPGCGCCEKWAAVMKEAGFAVTMEDDSDLAARRSQAGVPESLAGCHTAFIGDYVIEGHVPPDDVILFLASNSTARGLAVPGMPMGSPGMEMDGMKDSYDVLQFSGDGSQSVFASHT